MIKYGIMLLMEWELNIQERRIMKEIHEYGIIMVNDKMHMMLLIGGLKKNYKNKLWTIMKI